MNIHPDGLIDDQMMPRPSYYGAVLFKRLMGHGVLSTNFIQSQLPELRIWSHCTATPQNDGIPFSPYSYKPGSVTVLGINISRFFPITVAISTKSNTAHIFMLTSGGSGNPPDLKSSNVLLNGQILYPANPMSPYTVARSDDGTVHVTLYPASAAFIVLHEEDAPVCL